MSDQAKIGIIMGSQSDWPTMQHAADIQTELDEPHEVKIVSAPRTPDRMYDYARAARGRGLKAIIAGAGGAAHLPGMTAALTSVPVLGVPVQSRALSGQDSLLSIVQMPAGIPVGTLAIGEAGAKNAALLAAAILANEDAAPGRAAGRLARRPHRSCRRGPAVTHPLPQGATIGIVGGGQLGRMLALAAAELGFKTHVYCPEADCPAAQVAGAFTQAAYDDMAALDGFAAAVDAVTYEFENIPVPTVERILQAVPVMPSARALQTAQDRFEEKSFIRACGFGVADFFDITDAGSLRAALAETGGQGILKTRRFGYDGKGQWRLDGGSDLDAVMAELDGRAAILEALVPFEREISLLVARRADGASAVYDAIENIHRNHILHTSTLPAALSAEQQAAARSMAAEIAEALDYVGVLAIECFVVGEALLVNEMAPRVHNSGHLTQDACHCGQFEQHIRAIAGWPLGDATAHADAVMTNLLGNEIDSLADWAAKPATRLHVYGKAEARAGRKMAHVTQLFPKNG